MIVPAGCRNCRHHHFHGNLPLYGDMSDTRKPALSRQHKSNTAKHPPRITLAPAWHSRSCRGQHSCDVAHSVAISSVVISLHSSRIPASVCGALWVNVLVCLCMKITRLLQTRSILVCVCVCLDVCVCVLMYKYLSITYIYTHKYIYV